MVLMGNKKLDPMYGGYLAGGAKEKWETFYRNIRFSTDRYSGEEGNTSRMV